MMEIGCAEYLRKEIFPVAFRFLPGSMNTTSARVMMLAIALQESRCAHRVQIGGPAHGFWQFEQDGGCYGVLRHAASKDLASLAMRVMQYFPYHHTAYLAIPNNDVLAAVFARLLLYTLPQALPDRANADAGWDQYLDAWRPGIPHPETWRSCWDAAWVIEEMA